MKARESQTGITAATLVAALAILIIIVAFGIGALRHSTGPQSPSSSEVAGSTPPKQTSARPTAERPIARSVVAATPSKKDILSDPKWTQRCFERTREIMARLEAWQRTTSPGNAIGDKALCVDMKARWLKWADECAPGWGTPAQVRLLADWCESKSFTHVIILPSSTARR